MATIQYILQFYSFWHAGSGLGTRSDLDASVIKDDNGITYLPGKTIGGLVKDAAQDVKNYQKSRVDLDFLFGKDDPNGGEETSDGECSFENGCLIGYEEIVEGKLQNYLYSSRAATALDHNHQAKDHSLRKIEITLPCKLYGAIKNVPDDNIDFVISSLHFIKRLGYNRTRGLGRCQITII
ncbi:MAG: CRISPR-associated protein [Saprospiraceae bacterium]|uniref:CRISPR-associated protein n=1 Tax=Candidatus Opimibacter skivensis TaxID=2982028 RepID=A0A9D7SYW5_9BACT|nr:CRISPR-associated protein [Candidatus Opimibacter skivensis]